MQYKLPHPGVFQLHRVHRRAANSGSHMYTLSTASLAEPTQPTEQQFTVQQHTKQY